MSASRFDGGEGIRPRALWRVSRRLRTELALAGGAVRDGALRFYSGSDLTFASSIAYYALLSLFPFLLLALSLLGAVTAGGADRTEVLEFVFRYFPRQFEFIRTQLEALVTSRVPLGLAGSLVMIWAAMGVFGALTSAVNNAWGVERNPSYFKHKLVSFLMLLAAGLLLLSALLLVSAVNVVQASWFATALARAPGLHALEGLAVKSASLVLFIFVVGLICYFVPNTRVRFRDVWTGAVLTGVLWQAALAGFSWYVRDLGRFQMVHGSIAAVVVFLVWVYTSAVILLFGVEVSAANARLRASQTGSGPAAPSPDAAP